MEAAPLRQPRPAQAALMVLLMDDADAATLLARLSPEELGLLGQQMCELGEVAPEQISAAIQDFAEAASVGGLPADGRVTRVRAMMTSAVGPVRADSVMRRIAAERPPEPPGALALARWLHPEVILPLIAEEWPQVIAVLLVQLDPQVAARVLAGLPEPVQPDVVHRVATLGPVAPAALELLEELLETRITQTFGAVPLTMGGVREVADILNQAGKAAEARILPTILRRDKVLARAIEAELFKFEHLFTLDPQAMGTLLREVDNDTLIDALKGIDEPQRAHFFRAMSSRAADGLRDEIEGRGRIKLADVTEAQKRIIEIAKRLAADGALVLGGGDGDYV